jgi:SAM-dependent methyltransferase
MERDWWDAHADHLHVWGVDQPGAWEDGAAACLCAVVEALAPLSGRILDLGCGLGRLAIPLAALYPDVEVIGVDISPVMLAQAEAQAAIAGIPNVRFLQGDGRHLPELGFDRAYSVLLFQHLGADAVRQYIGEVAGGLRPGGRFVAQHVYLEHQPAFLSNSHTIETLTALGELAGLRWIETRRELVHPGWAWSVWERS